MKIISAGHMDVEDKILDPYRGIGCSIVSFDIYGFKPFWEFMIHYFVGEAKRVCGASISVRIAT